MRLAKNRPTIALRGWRLLLGAAPLAGVAYLCLVATSALAPIAQVWLLKLLVDQLTGEGAHLDGRLWLLAGSYAGTFLVLLALEPLEATLITTLQRRSAAAIDARLIGAGARLTDLTRIESPAFHDELGLVRERAFGLYWSFRALRNGIVNGSVLLGLLLLLVRLHPLLPLALIAVAAPHVWAERRVAAVKYQAMAERSRTAREMDYCAHIVTEPEAAKEVRLFGLGDFFLRRFEERSERGLAEINRARLLQLRLSLLCGLLYALALGGGLIYVAARARAGSLTAGDVALYVGAVIQAQTRLAILALVVGWLADFQLQVRGLFTFVDTARPALATTPEPARLAPNAPISGVIARDLTFRYPGAETPALRDASFTLPSGSVTALVGLNGAGKTTLTKLLARLYDPAAGTLHLDGRALHEYDLASLRSRIAVVTQDFARFALTFGENIAVGAVALDGEALTVEAAARLAGADDIAAKLPQGYATPLTRRFADGVELSGGEWQKLALARAAIRDAGLVILDEPTAALDAEAEERLFACFRELARGKTALLISHRFSTVRMADQILVL
ncbi:MAG TPA: ABC transporter ATP-binding protein, partial [Ktedonobacterales bacterium]|nr:ABC transporter ATP-binding protein [Ktedonobacterales bacterium]